MPARTSLLMVAAAKIMRVADAEGDCAAGLAGQFAGFKGKCLAFDGDLKLFSLRVSYYILLLLCPPGQGLKAGETRVVTAIPVVSSLSIPNRRQKV